MTKYLFIVKNPSFDSSRDVRGFTTDVFDASFVGVPSVEEACTVARQAVENGAELIDLCSGFAHMDARRVFDAIAGKAKVSYAGISFR